MLLYEYQAKALLEQEGIRVPRGLVAESGEELLLRLEELHAPLFLKAQVLSGGRGKAGGVRKARTLSEAAALFSEIKSMTMKTAQNASGLRVNALLVEEGQPLISEFYLAIAMDRARSGPVLLVSPKGGMDIEEISRKEPESLLRLDLDVARGVTDQQCRRAHFFLGHPKLDLKDLSAFLKSLFRAFLKHDAVLVEINPLGLTDCGLLAAVDAKMSLDDNADFRHPEWSLYRAQNIAHAEEEEAAKFGLSYVKLSGGKIGCMVNGAGLAMATMDLISLYGGSPANFLDVGGRATVEGTTIAFNILQRDPSIRAILVNIFGGIVQCDLIAQGILTASEKTGLNIPLVIRLEGTNAEKGHAMIKASGKPWIVARDFREAVEQAVNISEGKSVNTR
jgi:succinyl-CoA synthetase beta subunit